MTPTRKVLALGLIMGLAAYTAPVRACAQDTPQVIKITASEALHSARRKTMWMKKCTSSRSLLQAMVRRLRPPYVRHRGCSRGCRQQWARRRERTALARPDRYSSGVQGNKPAS
jgi:hypothetical protein